MATATPETIWKFPLANFENTVSMPLGAQIIACQEQSGVLCLWAIVNPDALVKRRTFVVYGTGQPLPLRSRRHIATYQHDPYVWHVFEEYP